MSDIPNRKLRFTFGRSSRTYQIARRAYPRRLVDDIIKISRVDKKSSVLDIGCGTGKSTLPFAESGAKILGIDISKNMITEARKSSLRYPNITYRNVAFEKLVLPENSFDLIISGTAFHWLKRKLAYGKIRKLLKNQGCLAIFWGSHPKKKIRFVSEVNRVLSKDASRYTKFRQFFGSMEEDLLAELKKSGMFKKIKFKKYPIIEKYTKRQYLELVKSRSYVIALDKEQKRILFKDLSALFAKYDFPISIPREYKLITAEIK